MANKETPKPVAPTATTVTEATTVEAAPAATVVETPAAPVAAPVAPVYVPPSTTTADQAIFAFSTGMAKSTREQIGPGKYRTVTIVNGERIEQIVEDGTEKFR
jgi:hypothetical protein